MAHRILVMSPLHNMGATVVSTLLTQAATFDNKTATLIFTQPNSNLPDYLGIEDINDPTRSIMQIVRLIDNGAISDEDILDYAHQFAKNAYLLNVADPSLTGRDRDQVITHIFHRAPTHLSICDSSEDIDSSLSQKLIDLADMIFLVLDMSKKSRDYMHSWLDSPQLRDKNNVYIIVNRYDEVVFAIRNLAKVMQIPANRLCKLHYNPWITKCCNTRTLGTLIPTARVLDPRTAALNCDFNELLQCINGDMVFKIKKGI